MTNEELSAIRTLFREEARSLFREEGNAIEQRLRGVIREEVNAAVYASEQRMGERIDALAQRVEHLEASVNEVKVDLNAVKADLNEVKAIQKQMQADLFELKLNYVEVKSDLRQAIAILDEVTMHIKDIRERQYSLETRVEQMDKKYEEHFRHIWQELQSLAGGIKDFTKEFAGIARLLNGRIADHEKLPFDQAHRRPGSAA